MTDCSKRNCCAFDVLYLGNIPSLATAAGGSLLTATGVICVPLNGLVALTGDQGIVTWPLKYANEPEMSIKSLFNAFAMRKVLQTHYATRTQERDSCS